MKILVTGSEGNIGRKLVPYLKKAGHEVMRMDIVQEFADDYAKHDVRDPLYACDLNFEPEIVYHMAGMVSRITCEKAPHLAVDTNIVGTSNIVQYCKSVGAKLINFSTSEVYGNQDCVLNEDTTPLKPNNIYGVTKLMAEDLVAYEAKHNGLKAVTVRPFMIYDEDETPGVHRSAMVRFAEALINKQKITVHKGAERSWLHISDAVEILATIMHETGVYNIGNPDTVGMISIARLMCGHLKLDGADYIEIKKLPEKMTLIKVPDLEKQACAMSQKLPFVPVETGIARLLKRMKCE